MPTPVLTYQPKYPLKHWISREFLTHTFGDGWTQIMTSEIGYNRADGTGNQTSYKGLNHFILQYNKAVYNSLAANLWIFFRTRLDNLNESFYFYNPSENPTIDAGGNNVVGRYLVKVAEPNKLLSRELTINCLFNYDGIEVVESRT